MGCVYLITHKDSKKVYVGQTLMDLQVRWQCHVSTAKSCKRPTHLHYAIRKYGSKAFILEFLLESGDIEILNSAERAFIQALDATNSSQGYNHQIGGRGWNEDTRQKMSVAREGKSLSL